MTTTQPKFVKVFIDYDFFDGVYKINTSGKKTDDTVAELKLPEKVVKEYAELQRRWENLQTYLALLVKESLEVMKK